MLIVFAFFRGLKLLNCHARSRFWWIARHRIENVKSFANELLGWQSTGWRKKVKKCALNCFFSWFFLFGRFSLVSLCKSVCVMCFYGIIVVSPCIHVFFLWIFFGIPLYIDFATHHPLNSTRTTNTTAKKHLEKIKCEANAMVAQKIKEHLQYSNRSNR